ncbi:zinc ribbon domain-containing protein [Feifania hominis]|uniref:Zinc-ribbon domain-containing protein n=1 Tax=Feifania hominis TaxID=2763660 RepID=A0A926HUK1_9FIRM|nr:zinc ribbon domain-containing protein [Feifania hominis]MBC8536030.1 zinc-ribbon domain-containing protein [Feifania hominis]
MGEGIKFCTECGTQVDRDAKFCPNCGAAQGGNDSRIVQSDVREYAPNYGGETPVRARSREAEAAVTYAPAYTDPTVSATAPEQQPSTEGKKLSYRVVGILAAAVLLILMLFIWKPFGKGHPIVGKWEPVYGNGYMEFKKDGALVVSSGMRSIKGGYKILSEDRIRIIPPAAYDEEPEDMTFFLEGDTLYLDGSMFQRIS